MDIPGDLRIAATHEWVRVNDDGTITIGITEHAQEQLGDLVFVETPEVDMQCTPEQPVAVVESVKAASDLYSPVNGQIIDTNGFKMQPDDVSEVENLMDPDDYQAMIGSDA